MISVYPSPYIILSWPLHTDTLKSNHILVGIMYLIGEIRNSLVNIEDVISTDISTTTYPQIF